MSDELKKLKSQVHDGISTFDFEGKVTPCIIIEEKKYDDMMSKIAGLSISVNTDLNILQDGLGNVFVEIVLTFSKGNIVKKFLVDAKTDLTFFEFLANTSMLALSSPNSNFGKENVFMIQLPRPEKAHNAYDLIKKALVPKNST